MILSSLKCLKAFKASLFFSRKISHHRDLSSINVMKYFAPPFELTRIGPHISVWIISRVLDVLTSSLWGNERWVCLPLMQTSHKPILSFESKSSPWTISFDNISLRICSLTCPRRVCHSTIFDCELPVAMLACWANYKLPRLSATCMVSFLSLRIFATYGAQKQLYNHHLRFLRPTLGSFLKSGTCIKYREACQIKFLYHHS